MHPIPCTFSFVCKYFIILNNFIAEGSASQCNGAFSVLHGHRSTIYKEIFIVLSILLLQVLKTIPTDRVQVDVIGVARSEDDKDPGASGALLDFMASRKYSLVHKFKHMYLFTAANFIT